MTLYAESSAVLAWLLGEPHGNLVAECFDTAEAITASELTLVECDRTVIRAVVTGDVSEAAAASLHAHLASAAADWTVMPVSTEVLRRARRRLPEEPVRALDALHVATALLARSAVPDVAVLSLDDRVRANARALGFDVLPESAPST